MWLRFKSKLKVLFPALKYRNFRLFFVGQALSLIGTYLQNTAEQWLVYAILTNSKIALGVLSAAQNLPVTFLSLFAGELADRKNKRKILIATQGLMTILAFIGAFLIFSGKIQFWQVVVLGTLLGIATAFDWPTRQSFWPEIISSKQDIPSAIALNAAAYNVGRMLGPALAGFLIGLIGIGGCYLLNGFSFLTVLIALLLIRPLVFIKKPVIKGSRFLNIRQGFSYLKHHYEPLLLILFISVNSVFVLSAKTLLPIYAKDIFLGREKTFAYLSTAIGIGATFGALFFSLLTRKIKNTKLLFISFLILIFSLFVFSLSRNLLLSFLTLFLAGFSFACFNIADNSLLQLIIPDQLRGRLISIYVLMYGGVSPIGDLFITTLAHFFGAPLAILTSLSFALIFLLLVFYRFKLERRLEMLLATTK